MNANKCISQFAEQILLGLMLLNSMCMKFVLYWKNLLQQQSKEVFGLNRQACFWKDWPLGANGTLRLRRRDVWGEAGRWGVGGEEQFKNMMWSYGASPTGNKRFKLGQRQTTHTLTHLHACTTHTHQIVELSHTRKQSRLGRQDDDFDKKLLQTV